MATEQHMCYECGEQNRASALFCRNCGSPLDAKQSAAEQESDPPTSDIPPPPIPEYGSTRPADQDWKTADRIARQAGMASASRRPWAAGLLAAIVILGAAALAGWQTGWPKAIFGAQKSALITPAAGPSRTPVNSPGPASSPTPLAETPNPTGSIGTTSNPGTVVQAYFSAINAHDYPTAWRLGGSNLGETYTGFVQGFSTTTNDTVTILSSSGNVITAQLAAEQNDGSTKTFAGTYTVSNGVITTFHVQQTG